MDYHVDITIFCFLVHSSNITLFKEKKNKSTDKIIQHITVGQS